MHELSVFVDESGDYGEYRPHSPFYIITMVFHDQTFSIDKEIVQLEKELELIGLGSKHCLHAGQIIRKEGDYADLSVEERKRILNKMVGFTRKLNVKYKCFSIEKKQTQNRKDLLGKLSDSIEFFIKDNYEEFFGFDRIKIYYDNGQAEISRIVSYAFNNHLKNVELRRVAPSDYKLFQVADMLCTFELIELKMNQGRISNTDS